MVGILDQPKLPTQNGVEAVAAGVGGAVTKDEAHEERAAGIIHIRCPGTVLIQGVAKVFPKVISTSIAGTM